MVFPLRFLNVGVGALFASHFLAYGLYLPFLPMVLEGEGLTSNQIGFILGFSLLARILASPVMTNISDRSGRRRFSIFIYSVLGSAFPVYLFASSGYWVAAICVVGLTIFWAPIVPLSDAYALDAVKRAKADYGRMRLWGSLAFVLANIGGGVLVSTGDYGNLLLWIAGMTIVTGLVALSLPGMKAQESNAPAETASGKAAVFRQPWFWALMVLAGILQGSHAAFYGFSSIYWTSIGLTTTTIGALWSVGVAAEIVLFLFAKRLTARIEPYTYLMIAAAAGVLRWSLFPIADHWAEIAVLQILHGLTFGAAHLGCIAILGKIVPSKWAGTGQGIMGTCSGLITAAGMTLSGPLYAMSPFYAFGVMAAGSLLALIVLIALRTTLSARINDNPATD